MTIRRILALLALAFALVSGGAASADPVDSLIEGPVPVPVDLFGDTYCVRAGLDPTVNLPTICIPLP